MTKGYSPPKIEVVEYAIYSNGSSEPDYVKMKMVETEQATLSDFINDPGEPPEDNNAKYGLPPCLKQDE